MVNVIVCMVLAFCIGNAIIMLAYRLGLRHDRV
jgi:hypothetical protein